MRAIKVIASPALCAFNRRAGTLRTARRTRVLSRWVSLKPRQNFRWTTIETMRPLDEETSRFLEAWMGVRQIVQAANFNRFHRAGLSATQFMTLNVVPEEGITLTELARSLNLSPASLNKTVDSLEQRGLLLRRRHVGDARKLAILNTPEGKRLKNAASGEFHRFVASLFKAMPQDERKGLVHGLERMVQVSALLHASSLQQEATLRDDAAPRAKRSSRQSPGR